MSPRVAGMEAENARLRAENHRLQADVIEQKARIARLCDTSREAEMRRLADNSTLALAYLTCSCGAVEAVQAARMERGRRE